MISRLAELGMVEMVILAGAALAFVVHPLVMLLASVRATIVGLATAPAAEKAEGTVPGAATQN